jgi:hypothetical protein
MAGPGDQIGPSAPQRGAWLRCRDHTNPGKIISILTSNYGTPQRPTNLSSRNCKSLHHDRNYSCRDRVAGTLGAHFEAT